MVRAIRTVSVERGHDPRRFALMPFGGAGPLHARDGRGRARHPARPGAGGARHPLRPGPRRLRPQGGLRRRPARCRSDRRTERGDRRAGRGACGRRAEALARARGGAGGGAACSSSASTCATSARTSSCRCRSRSMRCRMRAGLRAAFFAAHETAYGYHNPRRSGRGRELPADRARPALSRAARRRRSLGEATPPRPEGRRHGLLRG